MKKLIIPLIIITIAIGKEAGNVIAKEGKNLKAGERALEIKAPVYEKDIVTTDNATRGKILLTDKALLNLFENSRVSIENIADNKKSIFKFISGKIFSIFKSGNYQIDTEYATVGIRGTQFTITNNTNNDEIVNVIQGEILSKKVPATNTIVILPGYFSTFQALVAEFSGKTGKTTIPANDLNKLLREASALCGSNGDIIVTHKSGQVSTLEACKTSLGIVLTPTGIQRLDRFSNPVTISNLFVKIKKMENSLFFTYETAITDMFLDPILPTPAKVKGEDGKEPTAKIIEPGEFNKPYSTFTQSYIQQPTSTCWGWSYGGSCSSYMSSP